jgi:hypothetical protein
VTNCELSTLRMRTFRMIEINYRPLGLIKAKQIYFGDHLPPCDGVDYIDCKNFYQDIPCHSPYIRSECLTSIIDLTEDEDKLFGAIHKKRRNIIRQGLKKAYNITKSKLTREVLDEFYKTYNTFTVSKGAPRVGLTSLKALSPYTTVFIGKFCDITYEIILLIDDDQIVRYHKMARYGNHPYFKECYPMGSLLLWEAILHFKNSGCRLFDLGGITLDPGNSFYGVSQFKITFGGKTIPTYWYQASISPLIRSLKVGKKILTWINQQKLV